MSSETIEKQARVLLLSLRGSTQREAVNILSTAISLTVSEFDAGQLDKQLPVPDSTLLCRRQRKLSRIEQDTELQGFIHGLDRYIGLWELHRLLTQRFGKERTPSKSSLHRYLQKITSQANGGKQ